MIGKNIFTPKPVYVKAAELPKFNSSADKGSAGSRSKSNATMLQQNNTFTQTAVRPMLSQLKPR